MFNEPFTNKRFMLVFASIFALGATPLLIQQPNGAASAGLSLGFMLPIEEALHLVLFLMLGIYASFLRGNALILVPLSFILLYVVGISIYFDFARYALMPLFMLGSIILFALSMVVAGHRKCMMAMVIAASLGFHFGGFYAGAIPDIAAPIFFMIGNILAFALIFAVAISFGITLYSDRAANEVAAPMQD